MWRLGAFAVAVAAVVVAGSGGCSDDPEGCRTRQDCFDLGQTTAECVSGACVRTCAADVDCRGGNDAPKPNAVCERGLCADGCPDVACGAGETCQEGRCSLFNQSFEGATAGAFVTLETLGWNAIERPLRNRAAQVVWTGPPTCTAADRPERCAGPAGHGQYFLAVERAPTPAVATFEFGPSCRSCTCCRACRDPSARVPGEDACVGLGVTLPAPGAELMCGAAPAECTAVCQACDQCPAAPAGTVGEGLDACATQAAQRTCPGCPTYDQCVATKLANPPACPGGNFPACATPPTTMAECQDCLRKECDAQRPACWACRDYEQLRKDFPDDESQWRNLQIACEMQAGNGCIPTPINTPRSVLTDEEQAIESPAVNLAGQSGNLVVQLQYVPFNVGTTYRRVLQGQDPRTWPVERQEVRVQLCGASCADAASWRDATTVSGAPAVFPREDQRGNGLQFAGQSAADWTLDVVQVPIPQELRTAEFRFRLVPRLPDATRIGVDRVVIRRLP